MVECVLADTATQLMQLVLATVTFGIVVGVVAGIYVARLLDRLFASADAKEFGNGR